MPKNFYNLPSPWNPGYAIPENVMSEGLQRHAFTTKELPRGTYDSSTGGSAGYAIPQYIKEEGTGRGTFTTAWLPRGYYGPRIPHYQNRHPIRPGNIVPQPMGDVDLRGAQRGGAALARYGRKTAKIIMNKLARTPASQRDEMLKAISSHIDPTLYDRTKAEAQKAIARGVPAGKSLEVGLSSAMTSGFVGELAQIGKSKRAPQRNSLLGMGIYEALGAAAYVPNSSQPTPYVPQASGVDPSAATAAKIASIMAAPRVMVGDVIPFPSSETKKFRYRFSKPSDIPAAWARFIGDTVKRIRSGVGRDGVDLAKRAKFLADAEAGRVAISATGANPWMRVPKNPWYQALGLPAGMVIPASFVGSTDDGDGDFSTNTANARNPLVRFDHPGSGNPWGLYVNMIPNRENPTGLSIWFKWIPDTGSWYSGIVKVIATIVGAPVKAGAAVGGAVVDVAKAIGGAACDFLQTPGAAGGAAAAAGGPAAAVGVTVAAGLCGPGAPPVALPVDTGPSLLTTLAIGGGALFAIHLLTKKKTTP